MAKRADRLTGPQELAARMDAGGVPTAEIIATLGHGIRREDDPKGYNRIEQQLHRWRKMPLYREVWEDEVRQIVQLSLGRAVSVIRNQMNSDNEWIANKAANDVLALANRVIWAEEDKALTVRIEGMPEIGSPADPDSLQAADLLTLPAAASIDGEQVETEVQ